MKKLYYLSSLPRSGNTVLASILNQNPKIACTSNSIVTDILKNINSLKIGPTSYNNFPDKKSFDNVLKNVSQNYYKDWKQDVIIDRGTWGTPPNYKFVLDYLDKKPKIILLVRDVIEVLASFIDWSNKNPNTFLNSYGATVHEKCSTLMSTNGLIVRQLVSIRHILQHTDPKLNLLIKYNDFVKNPKKTIDKIYKFLEVKPFKHTFKNIKQFEVNNVKYDDSVMGANMHTIKTKKIEKTKRDIKKLLPDSVIKEWDIPELKVWTN